VNFKQNDDYSIKVTIAQANGSEKDVPYNELHYARGPARDFLRANSPIVDCREAIGLEIAAEKFGASFFGGGAMPGIVFKFQEGFQAFKTDEEKKKFIQDFQDAHSNRGRFRSMLLPKGIDMSEKLIGFENDKAQFLETRKYQRTVIAGAFGVPPYLVGDLERATFNNVEQQSINKISEVLLPIARIFEAAMERDLLTKDDRNGGIIIRFNLDGLLRGDFFTRQQGLKLQREAGVINASEWREAEGMNPRTDPGGLVYWDTGPSGQGMKPAVANNPEPNDANPKT
jgi:HK97 family phage portal protein